MFIPHEIYIGEVFIPPMLVAGILGVIAASITCKIAKQIQSCRNTFFIPLWSV